MAPKRKSRFVTVWGDAIHEEFVSYPVDLLRFGKQLKLNPARHLLMLNVLRRMHHRNAPFFESPRKIAPRMMGLTAKQVGSLFRKMVCDGILDLDESGMPPQYGIASLRAKLSELHRAAGGGTPSPGSREPNPENAVVRIWGKDVSPQHIQYPVDLLTHGEALGLDPPLNLGLMSILSFEYVTETEGGFMPVETCPSIDDLAARVCVSPGTMHRWVRLMEDQGLVEVIRSDRRGRGNTLCYDLGDFRSRLAAAVTGEPVSNFVNGER